jgi:hypothetical protein
MSGAAEQLVIEAMYALLRGDLGALRRCRAQLTDHLDGSADRALLTLLVRAVTNSWQLGWQPAELVREVRRSRGRRQARLATDMVAAEMREYPAATVDERWAAQLTGLGAEVWWGSDAGYLSAWGGREGADRAAVVECALDVLFVFHTLPKMRRLCPLPGTARSTPRAAGSVDHKVLRRVRALLDKAESTEFPEEAEALTGRAQQLIARYSIDAALLLAESASRDEPGGVRLPIDNPYEAPKALLLQEVARANRCRAIWHKRLGLSTVLGFPADLEAVELLFTSLLVQATAAMVHAGGRTDRFGRSRTRSFRHSFLSAYSERIGERLRDATDQAVRQATGETGRADLLPVLAARDEQVAQAVTAMFGDITEHRVSSGTDREGWAHGRAAADLATLRTHQQVH